jgi:hypothetical protein
MKFAIIIVLAALVAAASTTLAPFGDKEILWTKCINISDSNTACVSLFAVPENVTFGFEFALDNIVVDFPLIAGNETCAMPPSPPKRRCDCHLFALLILPRAVASTKPICSR